MRLLAGRLAIQKKRLQSINVIWLVIMLSLMFGIGNRAAAQTIIVPIDDVTFESPALPPPLWRTNVLVMKELALAEALTFSEKELEMPYTLNSKPIKIRAMLSYERVRGDFGRATSNDGQDMIRGDHPLDYDGNSVSTTLKLVWKGSRFSFGAMIPYDHLHLDAFDANRIGTILFGKYDWLLNDRLTIDFIANGNYIYNQIDSNIDNIEFKDFNTFGGNVGISLKYDQKGEFYRAITTEKTKLSKLSFTGSVSLIYQLNKDDAKREDNEEGHVVTEVEEQHLVMLGANVGMRIGNNFSLVFYSIWNYDLTSYKGSLHDTDDNYFDIIFEGGWHLSQRWKITSGYKKILGYEDMDADQLFFEVTLRL